MRVTQTKVVFAAPGAVREELDRFGVGHPLWVGADVLDRVPYDGRRCIDDHRDPNTHIGEIRLPALWQFGS